MPIEVMTMSMATAGTRYIFISSLHRCQYSCNQIVTVTLATSKIDPMIIMGITADAKMAVRPMILYQAATTLSDSAVNNVK